MLSTNQVLKRIADNWSIHGPGTVSCGGLSEPSRCCRQDALTELLDPFDMLGRDPIDEAGEPGIPLHADCDPDTAKL